MKVVILAGGFGTRISEESQWKPKPMVEIGGHPILWHIMKEYSHYGFNEFIICAGYKQHIIKQWFADYFLYNSDITFDFSGGNNNMIVHDRHVEPWKVTVVDTGIETMTGGRVRRVRDFLGDEPFMLTYGDGVTDVNLQDLLAFHQNHGKVLTITTVSIAQQKGVLDMDTTGTIHAFREKDTEDGAIINGGYMVCSPSIFDYLQDDTTILEQGPMRQLAAEGQLMGYFHQGFWQCMDTKREKDLLERLWATGQAPWKTWE